MGDRPAITNPDHPDHHIWGPQNRRKARERRTETADGQTGHDPHENGRNDPDENVGPCARCSHDPACGLASIDGDWLCHDDDHSCYFEDSVDRAANGSQADPS